MKNTYYFRHDYNCREDEKIQKLIFDFGYEGYGIYWAIVEMLYNNEGEIEYECERIAYILRTQKNIVEKIISHYNLFTVAYNKVSSIRIKKDLTLRKSKSKKAQESAYCRWKKVDTNIDANAMRTHNERNAIKERKGKEKKGKEKKIFSPPSLEEIKKYCKERSNNINANNFLDFYSSKGWMVGKNKMKDWKACIRTWENRNKNTEKELTTKIQHFTECWKPPE